MHSSLFYQGQPTWSGVCIVVNGHCRRLAAITIGQLRATVWVELTEEEQKPNAQGWWLGVGSVCTTHTGSRAFHTFHSSLLPFFAPSCVQTSTPCLQAQGW